MDVDAGSQAPYPHAVSKSAKEKANRDRPAPVLPGLIDSHVHLDYDPMRDDPVAALDRAAANGVVQVMHIGCDRKRIESAVEMCSLDPRIFMSVGIHPHDAVEWNDEVATRLRELHAHPRMLAIGETGLDYHYDRSPREVQRAAFAQQLELGAELGRPVVLHIRDAHEDGWDIVRAQPRRSDPGIVHCFTGDAEQARKWLDLGYALSFSGIATFPSANEIREAALLCPADRFLLETDAPFLAPVPRRGAKNEPANVAFTCEALAQVRGVDPMQLAEQASAATRRVLRMPEPGVLA